MAAPVKRIGMWTVLGNAFRVLFKNFGTALFLAVITGATGAVLSDLIVGSVLDSYHASNQQQRLIVMQLTQLVVLTLWGGTIGAWAAAAGVYLWVQEEKKQKATLYEAVNYGLNRWGRVLKPHLKALVIVQLGLIVVVPGILFGLQYAFVDAIATLDQVEKDPIARSRKLTSGRRGTLFRTFAVFLVWWIPFQLAGVYWLQGQGVWALALGGLIDHLVLLTLDLCMVQYYLDLFRKPAAPPSTGAPAAEPVQPAPV
ncbi:MAG: hypothetical protein ACOZNI_16955 [Myxococcota bacterium]